MTASPAADPSTADTATPGRLSLTEMQTSPHTTLPQRSYTLCLAGKAMATMRTLMIELQQIIEEDQAKYDAARSADAVPPAATSDSTARLGQPEPERPVEAPESERARAKREEIRQQRDIMNAHTGDLVVQGEEPGSWQTFCDEHPARDKNDRDAKFAHGVCNADKLLERFGRYAHSWNGDPMQPGHWEFIKSKTSLGDLNQLLSLVVNMHEGVVDLGKLRSASLVILSSGSD